MSDLVLTKIIMTRQILHSSDGLQLHQKMNCNWRYGQEIRTTLFYSISENNMGIWTGEEPDLSESGTQWPYIASLKDLVPEERPDLIHPFTD